MSEVAEDKVYELPMRIARAHDRNTFPASQSAKQSQILLKSVIEFLIRKGSKALQKPLHRRAQRRRLEEIRLEYYSLYVGSALRSAEVSKSYKTVDMTSWLDKFQICARSQSFSIL